MAAKRGTWDRRTRVLSRRIGDGVLTGQVVINQRYAAYQHVHQDLRHPRGGQANYLTAPLLAEYRDYMNNLARGLLSGELNTQMARSMESLSDQVAVLAPLETGRLRGSANPRVLDQGAVVYDRPPLEPRYDPPRRGRRRG